VGVVASGWVAAFSSGFRASDWPSVLPGGSHDTDGRVVETPVESEERQAPKAREIVEHVRSVRRSVLGDGARTRGDDVRRRRQALPPGHDVTPREACLEMRLAYPEQFGSVDCSSSRYDGTWR
jgi:hypothetical protein